MFLFTRNVC